ncbi:hypothetical protein LPJ56_003852 [Coemansia sp. RSA 2599]|nr:hypothetical protein LPJ75_003628 [Coemansia sp. RSA 2598]KAJ1818373.1 hypothetical protein LPJ56_003852 [Coemansia sp. RSA 2599]
MSFGSNVAVQLNTENYVLSRSHSLSNPHSASAYGSHHRATPVARSPNGQETGAQYISAHSGSVRQTSFPSEQVQPRASMDAIAAYTRDRGLSNALIDADTYQQHKAALLSRNSGENSRQSHAPAEETKNHVKLGAGSSARDGGNANNKDRVDDDDDDDDDVPLAQPVNGNLAFNLKEAAECIGRLPESSSSSDGAQLRIANQSTDGRRDASSRDSDQSADEQDIGNEHAMAQLRKAAKGAAGNSPCEATSAAEKAAKYDDEEEDDQPLMSLSRKLSSQMRVSAPAQLLQPLQLYVNSAAPLVKKANGNAKHGSDIDSEDDQPLSGLLMQPVSGSDDLGSLPLPMPRRVVDPDAVSNIDEMVNETVLPVRSSLSESPTSPMILPRGAVRKHSLLLHSSKPGAKDASFSKDLALAKAAGADRLSLTERTASAYAQSLSLNKRRSNVSAFAQRVSMARSNSTSDSEDDVPIVASAAEAARIHKENGWGQLEPKKEASGRPWTKQHKHSASTSSLNGGKWSQRGSTLGQQLTDELQKVREVLARSRHNDKAERRSWQVGDSVPQPPAKRPWVKHQENTVSESALLKKASDGGASGTASARAHIAGHGESQGLHPSSWSFAEKQRPMSTQYQRASRWLTKGFSGGGGSGADRGDTALPQSRSKDDVAAMSTSPQSAKSLSFSSKLNMKLGKLKRSLKPATAEATLEASPEASP